MQALKVITEKLVPGRWADARKPNATEMKATMVIAIEIEDASAKIRTGPPGDEKEDYDLDVWAGVLPISTSLEKAEADPSLKQGIEFPDYLQNFITGK